MADLSSLTDFSQQPASVGNTNVLSSGLNNAIDNATNLVSSAGDLGSIDADKVANRLLGLNGQERYQTWPEKLVRDALNAPHAVSQPNLYPEGSEENSWFEDQRNKAMVPAAMSMAAVAGTGGIAGVGEDAGAVLGSAPFLRPALKYQGKIYKAPMRPDAQHLDAIPDSLYPEFQKQAMSGEDISNFNFGFMNHKGQFLNREDALDYAIKEGLLNKQKQ